jgi:tRNA-binding protein
MNLGSRRIAGFESQVLMLGAPDANGRAVFLSTERDVPLGARVF